MRDARLVLKMGEVKLLLPLIIFFVNSVSCQNIDEQIKTSYNQDSMVQVKLIKTASYKVPKAPHQTPFRTMYLHVQNDSVITLLTGIIN